MDKNFWRVTKIQPLVCFNIENSNVIHFHPNYFYNWIIIFPTRHRGHCHCSGHPSETFQLLELGHFLVDHMIRTNLSSSIQETIFMVDEKNSSWLDGAFIFPRFPFLCYSTKLNAFCMHFVCICIPSF